MDEKSLRADKFLWSVRIFKTRALAAEACAKGRIIINGVQVKPSRLIKSGESFDVKKAPVLYSFKVVNIPSSRLSAKLVPDYIVNLTSAEELKKLEASDSFYVKRDPRTGRPTKRERRLIDKIEDNL
jgi:ribosome-associated heat shock protein Hsp15